MQKNSMEKLCHVKKILYFCTINSTVMISRTRNIILMLVLAIAQMAVAQMPNPVNVKAQLKEISPDEAQLVFDATIGSGWHMYSTNVVEYGPTPTSLSVESIS